MVHALEMHVVAAGIETSTIAARAVTMGGDVLQGYQVASPMPAAGIGVPRPAAGPLDLGRSTEGRSRGSWARMGT
jgi:EAL domain-containing protein (putative c-di-GMP-specific phosphodiesterase class I)